VYKRQYLGSDVKTVFENELKQISPDLIFTHNGKDAHQDHRFISELTWNTFRDHLILEYEIPKYDGDLAQPSVYVPLTQEICRKKVSSLMDAFQSVSYTHLGTSNLSTFLIAAPIWRSVSSIAQRLTMSFCDRVRDSRSIIRTG